jgi:hypothetical protein
MNHPLVADSLVGMASLDFLENKYDQSESRFDRAKEIRDASYGPQNLRSAEVLSCLAILKEHQKRYAEAKLLLLESWQIKRNLLGESDPGVLRTKANYQSLIRHTGR